MRTVLEIGTARPPSRPRCSAFFIVLTVGLFVLNGYLVGTYRGAVQTLESYEALAVRPQLLPVGTRLPPLRGKGTDGTQLEMTFEAASASASLVLMFTPRCYACEELWKLLSSNTAEITQQHRLILVDVSSTVTPEFAASRRLGNVPIVATPEFDTMLAYNMYVSPQLLVIGTDGRLLSVASGAPAIARELTRLNPHGKEVNTEWQH